MLHEISQAEKDTYHMSSLMCGSWNVVLKEVDSRIVETRAGAGVEGEMGMFNGYSRAITYRGNNFQCSIAQEGNHDWQRLIEYFKIARNCGMFPTQTYIPSYCDLILTLDVHILKCHAIPHKYVQVLYQLKNKTFKKKKETVSPIFGK